MATDHLKKTYQAVIQQLEDATALENVLLKVHSFYALGRPDYQVQPEMLTIMVLLGDSDASEPFTNESTKSDYLPTDFILVLDTLMPNEANMWLADEKDTMLDYEYMVLRALQEDSHWNTTGNNLGWDISGIERNVAAVDNSGNVNPKIMRTEITLTVNVYLDRTDGPARTTP